MQSRFNLLHEETEGYAKLITELATVNDASVQSVSRNICALMRQFNLDPNQCLTLY